MKTCNNCGHKCHCGTTCTQEHKDGDGKDILILCCSNCRHDIDIDSETKYDLQGIEYGKNA